ncbi:MAG: glutathione S-transferase [Rhodoferax sp.]|nr:glutathione S-transferase [Rhodoferax sp.]
MSVQQTAAGGTTLPVLYSFRRCPYAMRARLALRVCGVACELREVVLRNKPAALLNASAKGTVPVLVDGLGHVIDQSLDIMRWALNQHDPEAWLAPEDGKLDEMLAVIAQNDGAFKRHLDRYKYPQRYCEEVASLSPREAGSVWLMQLESRLAATPYLFGTRPALADMAVAPFVRQWAHVDAGWFAAQPWPRLIAWLSAWESSALLASVMEKYAPWQPGAPAVYFG